MWAVVEGGAVVADALRWYGMVRRCACVIFLFFLFIISLTTECQVVRMAG